MLLLPAARRAGDAQLLPVLGHGAPGQDAALLLQQTPQLFIRQGMSLVLPVDQLPQLQQHRPAADIAAVAHAVAGAQELHQLLGQSKIVLNITRTDFYGAETGINLRIFEALAAGCFLLTDHCDELGELFRIGEEIETFRSSAELTDKVTLFLSDEGRRKEIARRGHDAFCRKHTWRARIEGDLLPALARTEQTAAPFTASPVS